MSGEISIREWDDENIYQVRVNDSQGVVIELCDSYIRTSLSKEEIIKVAKAVGVKPEDLE